MSRSRLDEDSWRAWNATKSKDNLSHLFSRVNPILQKEVSRWAGGAVARPILEIEAKKIALNSFNNFDPNKSKLSTHLTNNLKGLSREVYTYSAPARLPEHRMIKAKTFVNAEQELSNTLGRIPTVTELASELKWNQKEVGRFRNEIRGMYSESMPTPPGFEQFNSATNELDFVYHDLNNQDKTVFEHTTGYGGAPVLSTRNMVAKTGLTSGQISHSKRRIKNKVLGYRGMV